MKKKMSYTAATVLLLTAGVLLLARVKGRGDRRLPDPSVELAALLRNYSDSSSYNLYGTVSTRDGSLSGTLLESAPFRCCANATGRMLSVGSFTRLDRGGLCLSYDTAERVLSLDSSAGTQAPAQGMALLSEKFGDTSYCRLSVLDSGALLVLRVDYALLPGVESTRVAYEPSTHRIRSVETVLLRPSSTGGGGLRTVAVTEVRDAAGGPPDVGAAMGRVFSVEGGRSVFAPAYRGYRMSVSVP